MHKKLIKIKQIQKECFMQIIAIGLIKIVLFIVCTADTDTAWRISFVQYGKVD